MSDKKIDLFTAQQHALDKEFHTCPKCGQKLVFRSGKAGAFLGCEAYPNCDYIKPLHQHDKDDSDTRVIDDSECPKCHSLLAVKHGRYGLFIGCTAFPECDYIEHQNEDSQASQNHISCPKCSTGELVERLSRFGKKFFACSAYPKCEYALNFEPVEHKCPNCDWPVMMKKHLRGKDKLVCPQKKCKHQIDAV
ncbi:type I DNA topoisomerase [Catenovulum maritimum]|uniref:Cytochrome C551 n=1 Tax=Catenovulum maritimum TaxID=1513271 RepID=A0A0J8GTM2_9ALTE|nr:topoisomerase DNA-binding C4 zinc finger domain-containing protein [Catenovulum maritimum]KMT66087.1 cytochrome C551 [Catenovulum maritimum]